MENGVLNCWWEYQGSIAVPTYRDSAKYFDLKSIQSIIENCTELKELNFWNGVFPDGPPLQKYQLQL